MPATLRVILLFHRFCVQMIIVLAFSSTNISNFLICEGEGKERAQKGSPGRIAKGNPHFPISHHSVLNGGKR